MWENVYLYNGTWYIVTDDQASVPKIRDMISTGVAHEAENYDEREPTEQELQIISTAQAKFLWGTSATRVTGTTFVINDAPQFIGHFYQ